MSAEKERPSFFKRLWLALGKTMRFLLFLIVLLGLAALIYKGMPYVYERVITPLDRNTEEIAAIQAKQEADMEALSAENEALANRLNDLEQRQTESAQQIASFEGQLVALDEMIEKHSVSLKQLDEIQETLETLGETTEAHDELLNGENSVIAGLEHDVQVSRVIELLSRGRLYLAQSNFGSAQADVQAARDLLAEFAPEDDETLQIAVDRLDMALGNLPDFPVVAIGDVDLAWQLLVSGMPVELAVPTEAAPTADAEAGETSTP